MNNKTNNSKKILSAVLITILLLISHITIANAKIQHVEGSSLDISHGENGIYKCNLKTEFFPVAHETTGPFEYKQDVICNFRCFIQEGIATDGNGRFFISSGFPPFWGKITIAELGDNNDTFECKDKLKVGWHVGDPFCDCENGYLMVPKSNWRFINPMPDKAKCRVYFLSNLSELPNSPFNLTLTNGNYITGASSGAYHDGFYYFSTYNEKGNLSSIVYKFSFDPCIGFTYTNWSHSLGKTKVQGIEFHDDKCYFIRAHGEDPHVYWINTTSWNENNLGRQNLEILSNQKNGPYEGITFDTSKDGEIMAYFGFGFSTFKVFNLSS